LDNLGAADRADVSNGEDRGLSEFLQMYVLNLSGGIVKLFENTCGSVDVSGLCGET
jgi:hypothetical protein